MNVHLSATSPGPRRRGIADQAAVRAHNLAAVAQLVRARGECSRRVIGESLGLNKGTVSGLVGELITRGLLEEGGYEAGGPGRPTRLLKIDTRIHAAVVVEVLTDHAVLGAWTLALTRIAHRTLPLSPRPGSAERDLSEVCDALIHLVAELRNGGRTVGGVVIALPGLINSSTGTLIRSAPLRWRDIPVRAILRRSPALQDMPIVVDRVANLATIAESRAVPEISDLICLHGGEAGVGVGVITGGRPLAGAHGLAGELLFPSLRSSASHGTDLPKLLRRAANQGTASPVHASLAGSPEKSDAPTMDYLATQLGVRLATLIALLDPQMVVLAGSLAPLAGQLAAPLDDSLRTAWHPHPHPDLPVRPGIHGTDAPLVGGAIRLTDRIFAAFREHNEDPSAGRQEHPHGPW